MGAMVAGHQMRRAGPGTVSLRALAQGLDYARIGSKTEVIVAAERKIFTSVHQTVCALGAVVDAAAAAQSLRLERDKLSREFVHRKGLIKTEAWKQTREPRLRPRSSQSLVDCIN